jgi:hypothetical protein
LWRTIPIEPSMNFVTRPTKSAREQKTTAGTSHAMTAQCFLNRRSFSSKFSSPRNLSMEAVDIVRGTRTAWGWDSVAALSLI